MAQDKLITLDNLSRFKGKLGTAALKDVPASGNASSSQVVMGNDSRLSDSRPASDVPSWAKASSKPSYTASEVGAIASTAKGAANGVAELGSDGKVPSGQLPSYVDDVLEYDSKSSFPTTGEAGKIYVDKTTNLTWRWSGTTYVEISPSLALGTTSSTAYRGDYGNTAYGHATESGKVGATVSGLYKVASTAQGHIASLTAVQKSDITALGIPAQDTTYSDATTSASGLMSSTDKTKLNGVATGAEVNQNAFSNVKVGSTIIAADGKTDTLELVAGSNITITPDATNDKVTIASSIVANTGTAAAELKKIQIGNTVYSTDGMRSFDVSSISSGSISVGVNNAGHLNGEVIAVNTGSYTGTTSNAWVMALNDGQEITALTISKADGTAFKDAISANSLLFVKCNTSNNTATLLGIVGASGGSGVAESVVGTVESNSTASKAYAVGEHFIRNNKFCTVIAAIASGATLTLNTNYVEGTIADNITKRVNYSTTEHVIGTWLDGSTLYEKTIDCGSLSTSSSRTVPCNMPSGAEVVGIHGTYMGTGVNVGIDIPIPYANCGSTINNIQVGYSNGSLVFEANNPTWGNAYVTLQYVKR